MPSFESIESVVSALWRASWQASILVLLVLLAQGLMRRRLSPAWRSALWLLVVVRLLLPATPPSGWSLFNLTDGLVPSASWIPDPVAANNPISWIATPSIEWKSTPEGAWRDLQSGLRRADVADQVLIPQEWPTPAGQPLLEGAGQQSPNRWLVLAFWIWLAGVVLMAVRLAWGSATFARRIRHEPDVRDGGTLALFAQCREVMGTRVPVKLVETDLIDSPALFGFRRLNLLLPPGTTRRLTPVELRHVFLHELAHVRRGDVLLNWLTTVLQVLHWFNPVIWFAFARMRADREEACDALALARGASNDRAAYGATVLKLVSGLGSTRPAPGLVGISEGKSNLKHRIRMIASHRNPRRGSFLAVMILVTLGLVSLTDARATRNVEQSERAGNAPAGTSRDADPLEAEVEIDNAVALEAGRQPNLVPTPFRQAPGREAIQAMLRSIVLEEVAFDNLRLRDVLTALDAKVIERDPDRRGFNFTMMTPHGPTPHRSSLGIIDPATGQELSIPWVAPNDITNVVVRIMPPLRKVRLGDVLDAIVRVADRPIRYSVYDGGVVFSPKPPDELIPLETRIFRVNPNTFLDGLYVVGSIAPGDLTQRAARGAFEIPRVFVPDHFRGLPGVTSTNLNEAAQMKVANFFRAAGIDVMSPNQIHYNYRSGVLKVRATPKELDIVQQALEILSETPPQITLDLLLVEITRGEADDPQLGRVNGSEEEGIATGILTERQFKAVLRQLENRPGVRIMAGPRVTTLSGRETLISAGLPDGAPVEVGLLPVVRSNGYDIDLPLKIRAAALDAEQSTGQPPSSESTDRRLVTSTVAVVRHGQTVVLGGLRPEDFRSTADDAHALQDLPVVGPLFRREAGDTRVELLLFITPTIIDPAGNRVYVGDRLRFDPDTIPDQQPNP
jgi:beta-lactamase regulating signal transducer with metallopeptidase domain